MVDPVMVATAVFYGAITAAAYAAAGFFKSRGSDPGQTFDKQKFLATLILGLILGGIGGGLGWNPATVEAWLSGLGLLAGVMLFVEWLAKGILRRVQGNRLSTDTGGQMGVVSIVALLTAIPSIIVAYALFLTFVGGNGLILGSVLGAVGVITTKVLIDARNRRQGGQDG